MLPRCVFGKLFAKLIRYQHRATFALQAYFGMMLFNGIGGYVAQLAYSYTRCADGLHDKAQPIVPACISCIYQPFIFRRAQFPVFRYEGFALHL